MIELVFPLASCSLLGLINYYLFFFTRNKSGIAPPAKKAPVERGYEITSFGTNPNRLAIKDRHKAEDSRQLLNEANEKAYANLSKRTQLTNWGRELQCLGITGKSRACTASAVFSCLALMSTLLVVLSYSGMLTLQSQSILFAIILLILACLQLLLLKNLAHALRVHAEDTLPFSLTLIWSATTSRTNIEEALGVLETLNLRAKVYLPALDTLREVARNCSAQTSFREAAENTDAVQSYAKLYTFCNLLDNYQRGIGMREALKDMERFFQNRRKTKARGRYSINQSFTYLSMWCRSHGLHPLSPLLYCTLLAYILCIALLCNAFSLVLFCLLAGGPVVLLSTFSQQLAYAEDQHLQFLIRPYLNLLRKGLLPDLALIETRAFVAGHAKLAAVIEQIEQIKGNHAEINLLIVRNLPLFFSPHTQRFLFTFLCALNSGIETGPALEEIMKDMNSRYSKVD